MTFIFRHPSFSLFLSASDLSLDPRMGHSPYISKHVPLGLTMHVQQITPKHMLPVVLEALASISRHVRVGARTYARAPFKFPQHTPVIIAALAQESILDIENSNVKLPK